MVKVKEFEVPPPGGGLKTVTVAVPAAAMSLAEIRATIALMVPLPVVGRSLPFQRTTDPGTKLSPTTVNRLSVESTNCSPAGAQLGKRLVIAATGLLPGLVMVKFIGLEVPPPGAGLVTVTGSVPDEPMLEAGMAALNCVELRNVVAGAAAPKLTIEAATKLVPLIVSVNAAPPATALFGEMEAIVGV
jgi:hypothetical protein